MGYYENIRTMKQELQELIHQNKGKTISISSLSLSYGMRYGFGKRVVENALKDFKEVGQIVLYKDSFEVVK